MKRMETDIKRRWLKISLTNMLILFIAFGALAVGYGVFIIAHYKKVMEGELMSYAEKLALYDFEYLKGGDGENSQIWREDIYNPEIAYALYSMRENGSYDYVTRDVFLSGLNESELKINIRKLNEIQKETIGGQPFFTYTVIVGGAPIRYIKVFTPNNVYQKAVEEITLYSIPFAAAFVILGIFISAGWAYVEVKSVITAYYKQKNIINDMSHEVRTPLAIIKGNLENILASPGIKVEEAEEQITACLKEVDFMSNMSSGLLSISHAIESLPQSDFPNFVDMCCGSGVFVVETINQTIERYHIVPGDCTADLLHKLTNCVVGFDIDPLAVLLSKLNWAMAMRSFAPHAVADFVIPIYHADSLFTVAPITTLIEGNYEEQDLQMVFDGEQVILPGFLITPANRRLFDSLIHACYDCYISKHIMPFYTCDAAKALLPMRKEDGCWIVVDESGLVQYGAGTLTAFQNIFAESGESAHQYFNRINYRHKLNPQIFDVVDDEKYLVMVGTGGGYTCASYVPFGMINKAKTIVDQTIYWHIANSHEEALYITGMLNSMALDTIIADFQPEGAMGRRHVHTLPYAVTPPFNAENAAHMLVVERTQTLIDSIAVALPGSEVVGYYAPSSSTLAVRRRKLRLFIHELPESKGYEEACREVYNV